MENEKIIQQQEKKALFISILLMAVFISMIVYGIKGVGVDLPTCISNVQPYETGKVVQVSDKEYEIYYVARMWFFDPQNVEIPVGSKVRIYLTSLDVTHGLHIWGTNVNLMAIPNAVNYYEVKFNKEGEYIVSCHEYCGIAHQNMIGKIIVKSSIENLGQNINNIQTAAQVGGEKTW
ncbi:MAG: cytochrome c oxidase subunit II [Candidatus Calescibacterium sp.]|nr:cytochrome c oxidase subunit II [Candidatus Calescibacterium sp.]MCX7734023.1 cytochrome c oxidase subunit II [bacterium]MDW8086378.1 cytochrome c oxidase subunit II [Candidatus Calescibacterium sp.]